jgi:hypothetical protein
MGFRTTPEILRHTTAASCPVVGEGYGSPPPSQGQDGRIIHIRRDAPLRGKKGLAAKQVAAGKPGMLLGKGDCSSFGQLFDHLIIFSVYNAIGHP